MKETADTGLENTARALARTALGSFDADPEKARSAIEMLVELLDEGEPERVEIEDDIAQPGAMRGLLTLFGVFGEAPPDSVVDPVEKALLAAMEARDAMAATRIAGLQTSMAQEDAYRSALRDLQSALSAPEPRQGGAP